ncbi:stalk domain-containing protein [Bacillus sp. FJAT-45350]|uniref:stalk domain-containing protein n=1 Tax=Bacillus sp. FJAT-45350 TaxID=2011014 RepID=UPI000BB7F7F8|nr:stalk domain-containing protein [Bacillus sp. FJAT-45350]
MRNWLTLLTFLTTLLVLTTTNAEASGEKRVTILLNTTQIYEGEKLLHSREPHVVRNGVTYVSMRSVAQLFGFTISYNEVTRQAIMQNSSMDIRFVANQTSYQYNGSSANLKHGMPYIERGTLMLPLRVVAEHANANIVPKLAEQKVDLVVRSGQSKEQVSTIEANFETDKAFYKMGETIQYRDMSKNGGTSIIRHTWSNREPAFFQPGRQTITLEIENNRGEISQTSRTITINDEVLYTKDQYLMKHSPIGDKISIDRHSVLTYPVIAKEIEEVEHYLVRSNSPEKIHREGVFYQDTAEGDVRLFIHHENAREENTNLYVIARHRGNQPVLVTQKGLGIGGPNQYVSFAGKSATTRYLQSLSSGQENQFVIQPGEAVVLLPQLSSVPIRKGQTVTAIADFYTPVPMEYQIIALDSNNKLADTLPFLRGVNPLRDGIHIRGSFPKGNKKVTVKETLGIEMGRLIIADGGVDSFVTGTDIMTKTDERNLGNFGVVYTIQLEKVAPNTTILLNPRGGQYAGSFIVNGKVVGTPEQGILEGPTEAVPLYRTGSREERVELKFMPPAGSNLPINLLFIPQNN